MAPTTRATTRITINPIDISSWRRRATSARWHRKYRERSAPIRRVIDIVAPPSFVLWLAARPFPTMSLTFPPTFSRATNIEMPPPLIMMDKWFDLLQCTCVGLQYKKSSGSLYLGLGSRDQTLASWLQPMVESRPNCHGGPARSLIRFAARRANARIDAGFGHRDWSSKPQTSPGLNALWT
jgi:hypothetical protein